MNSKTSIELCQALHAVPFSVRPKPTPLCSRADEGVYNFTKSFSGVRSESLPTGLTDDVDVDLRSERQVRLLSSRVEYINLGNIEEGRLDPLDPDLPDADEVRERQRRARQVEREEALRHFEETQAQL